MHHPQLFCTQIFFQHPPSPAIDRKLDLLRIVPRRLLARLQLLQIIPTSAHVTTSLVEALRELRRIRRTRSRRLVLIRALAVVHPRVHRLGIRIGAVLLVGSLLVGRGGSGFLGRRGAAAEEAADCVADGRSDCDAAVGLLVLSLEGRVGECGVRCC